MREFALEDLERAAHLGERLRRVDPQVEPFAHRLAVVARSPRALLELWRVAEDEEGEMQAISFAALRHGGPRATLEIYAAVAPELRRKGLGRALIEPLLGLAEVTLRARVREESGGLLFLAALGFAQVAVQLSLSWQGVRPEPPLMPALSLRPAVASDADVLERLANEAWAGAPDSFATRADEIAQLFGERDRLVLVARSGGRPVGYLSAVWLGATLGIEEVAVLPELRRMGVGRALLAAALQRADAAVLSVSEENRAARALYRSLGFRETARRLVMERHNG